MKISLTLSCRHYHDPIFGIHFINHIGRTRRLLTLVCAFPNLIVPLSVFPLANLAAQASGVVDEWNVLVNLSSVSVRHISQEHLGDFSYFYKKESFLNRTFY